MRLAGLVGYHPSMATVTAQLLMALETIEFELTRMETLISGESLNPNDASTIRHVIVPMKMEASKLIEWLGTARLEEPNN
jgi:hypothetical protein